MSFFARLSRKSRERKLALFNNVFRPTKQMRILDVCGDVENVSGDVDDRAQSA